MKPPTKRDHLLVAKTRESMNDKRLRELLNRIQAQPPFRLPSGSYMDVVISDKDINWIRRRLGISTYGAYMASRPPRNCTARPAGN